MSASIPGIWETPAQLPLMSEAEILQILPALPDSRAGEGLTPLFFWEKLFIKEKKKSIKSKPEAPEGKSEHDSRALGSGHSPGSGET